MLDAARRTRVGALALTLLGAICLGSTWLVRSAPPQQQSSAAATTIDHGVALVTGGCGYIGSYIAVTLANTGLDVVITTRHESFGTCAAQLATLQEDFLPGNLITIEVVDLASSTSVSQFLERLERDYGERLRVLINTASFMSDEAIRSEPDGFEMAYQVNVWAAFALASRLFPLLAKNAPASIVHCASGSGLNAATSVDDKFRLDDLQFTTRPYESYGQYEQTKAAQIILAIHGGRLYNGTGVYVNALHPGMVWGSDKHGFRSHMVPKEMEQDPQCLSGCTTAADSSREIARIATRAPAEGWQGHFFSIQRSRPRRGDSSEAVDQTYRTLGMPIDEPRFHWTFGSKELGAALWSKLEAQTERLLGPA